VSVVEGKLPRLCRERGPSSAAKRRLRVTIAGDLTNEIAVPLIVATPKVCFIASPDSLKVARNLIELVVRHV
jgi:hypothetical protein